MHIQLNKKALMAHSNQLNQLISIQAALDKYWKQIISLNASRRQYIETVWEFV